MRRNRNAKIIATLGPSSTDPDTLEAMFAAGADVFRLNFSHGEHADHQQRLFSIRQMERRLKRPIAILLDLQGPKIRVGTITGGEVELEPGMSYRLDMDDAPGDDTRAPLPHPEIFAALKPGMTILLDDGKLNLTVKSCGPDHAETEVVAGGPLKDRKGVNIPGAVLPISPLTDKDREDLEFGLDLGVDWVALSFVQRPEDIAEVRQIVDERASVMAKIEKPAAIDRLDAIVELCDAVMVARGDLGVEMPPEDVPGLQKRIIHTCREAGCPVVVATQMLESMIDVPAPTRAEASDVATAVYDGADAVMLSAETAAGHYPVEAVAMMDRIITSTEHATYYRNILHAHPSAPDATAADAISAASAQVAATLSSAAIVCYTMSGSTALRAARERPDAPIMVLTNKRDTSQRLALLWGAHCVHTADVKNTQEMVDKACRLAEQEGFAKPGDKLVIMAGVPFGTPGTTNLLRIATVG
ncbi:MAG: pyruvate kinase [Pseudomonadota bacterium]